jgi:diguanylate cyclase (GGDEF)-like protein
MPETNAAGALRAAERARQTIEATTIPHRGSSRGLVTISAGAATSHAVGAPPPHDWREVLERADQALYHAKRAGRNRVCAAEPAPAVA